MSKDVVALILAAGKGTRMKSDTPKVLHTILGHPMLKYVIDAVHGVGVDEIFVVVGHHSEEVKDIFKNHSVSFIHQENQLGTGHAVLQAEPVLESYPGSILILPGDTPLITSNTISSLVATYVDSQADFSLLTTHLSHPEGYGRILRSPRGTVMGIVEEKDATEAQKNIKEVNAGVYCVKGQLLFTLLHELKPENVQGEYYLTDCIQLAYERGYKISHYLTLDPEETTGINDRVQLAQVCGVIKNRINTYLMQNGVSIMDPETTYIEPSVTVLPDTMIFPGTHIRGNTKVSGGCFIGPHTYIEDSQLEEKVNIEGFSHISGACIKSYAKIGPFTRIRPETVINEEAKVGNFVEIKKSNVGKGSKVSHLSYIGDTDMGCNVNIGAGTITCNYDGITKHKTIIEDEVFVGSDTQFVAPVTIGQRALIGAGTTVTKNVPPYSLVLSRVSQLNREGWAKTFYEKKRTKST